MIDLHSIEEGAEFYLRWQASIICFGLSFQVSSGPSLVLTSIQCG